MNEYGPLLTIALGIIAMFLAAFGLVGQPDPNKRAFHLEWIGLALAFGGLAWLAGWFTGWAGFAIALGLIAILVGALRWLAGNRFSIEWVGVILYIIGVVQNLGGFSRLS